MNGPPLGLRVGSAPRVRLASAGRNELGENLPFRLARSRADGVSPLSRFDAAARHRHNHQSRPLMTLARSGHYQPLAPGPRVPSQARSLTLRCSRRMFFRLSTWELWLIIAAIVLGFVALGYVAGRVLREHLETLREPVGVVQGALLALVGLVSPWPVLGDRAYDSRRAAVVDDANTIGTTYLRAQTLAEPTRTPLPGATQALHGREPAALALGPDDGEVPTDDRRGRRLQRQLWRLAGNALEGAPRDSAPRLYVETLNQMIDQQTVAWPLSTTAYRRRPGAGDLRRRLRLRSPRALHGHARPGATTVILAGSLVTVLLLVLFDLDRPTRGLIRVPDGPLVALRASMALPPAAQGP